MASTSSTGSGTIRAVSGRCSMVSLIDTDLMIDPSRGNIDAADYFDSLNNPAIGRLAYDLLKRYAKSDGLRTFDSLIAATAIKQDCALVSRNRKHFAMIGGLRFEVPRY